MSLRSGEAGALGTFTPEQIAALKKKLRTDRERPDSIDSETAQQFRAFEFLVKELRISDDEKWDPQAVFRTLRQTKNYDFIPLLNFAIENPDEISKIKAKLLNVKSVQPKPEVKPGKLSSTARLEILKHAPVIVPSEKNPNEVAADYSQKALSAANKLMDVLDAELQAMIDAQK